METISKILKGIFFNDEQLDMAFAAKVKYVIYGVVLGVVLTFVGCLYLDDDTATDTEEAEYVEDADI